MTNPVLDGVLYSVYLVKTAAYYGKVLLDGFIQEIYDLGIRFQEALTELYKTDR